MDQNPQSFWSITVTELQNKLHATSGGLTTNKARERLKRYGANSLKPQKQSGAAKLFVSQFKSPIILILLGSNCIIVVST